MRECGGCVVCCYVTEVVELLKPVNSLCRFASPGSGCSTYATRPEACRKFSCAWLSGEISDTRLRPDRCGVMFERLNERTMLAFVGRSTPQSWRAVPVRDEMERHIAMGTAFIVKVGDGDQWHVALGTDGRTAEEVVGELRRSVEERSRWQPRDIPQT